MRRTESTTLPIVIIGIGAAYTTGDKDVGPVVSSSRLVAGCLRGLMQDKYGLMITTSVFNRWMMRCMAAATF